MKADEMIEKVLFGKSPGDVAEAAMGREWIGKTVRPLAGKKRRRSHWLTGFANKKYKVIDTDSLDGDLLLVLQTGPDREMDYTLVYPDEVVEA